MNKNIIIKTKEKKYRIEIKSNSLNYNLKKIIKSEDKVFILIDEKVSYAIKNLKLSKNIFVLKINGSEKIKSFKFFQKISENLIFKGIDRNSCIIAIGGGTILDLSGFIASTILRGVKLILFPTTLLSQVDSSIGGKNGINSSNGKNLIGTFYQPDLIIIDPKILLSLSKRELKSGYAEVLKHALISDLSFFKFLDKNYHKIFNLELKTLEQIIFKSIKIKSKFVNNDTKEILTNDNSRAILNFGHTFGHALETYYKYNNKFTHGEAISIGMIIASKISYKFGYINEYELKKIFNHFIDVGLPTKDKNMYNSEIFTIIQKDKKNLRNDINLILLKKIGKAHFSRGNSIKKIKKNIY